MVRSPCCETKFQVVVAAFDHAIVAQALIDLDDLCCGSERARCAGGEKPDANWRLLRAASGQAAAPPRRVMNSRRFMQSIPDRIILGRKCRPSGIIGRVSRPDMPVGGQFHVRRSLEIQDKFTAAATHTPRPRWVRLGNPPTEHMFSGPRKRTSRQRRSSNAASTARPWSVSGVARRGRARSGRAPYGSVACVKGGL